MIETTQGIVLHTIPYSESSVISHMYTLTYGPLSFINSNVRVHRAKTAYFRPLSIVTIQFYLQKNNALHRIKHIEYSYIPKTIYDSVYKANIALFVGEFLHSLCIHNESNPELYKYIYSYITFLDSENISFHQSHLIFLTHLLKYWGIIPQNNHRADMYFIPQKGIFEKTFSEGALSLKISNYLNEILQSNSFSNVIEISKTEKIELLEAIIQYFQFHTHSTKTLKTLDILKSIFS
ncbi:MAG TPA: recombination protein O N-terminal domain-containing protein [Bacteroidales bacterium]|jgi:DNA repair protein RecO (recombination protein O)|nr:recombination protein O N-terminal domain-containing protein [Bacteroidales bacterium]